jgi:hypothetical protein
MCAPQRIRATNAPAPQQRNSTLQRCQRNTRYSVLLPRRRRVAARACARNRYADFALFHVLDATAAQFDAPAYGHAWAKADVPALKAFYAWMRERRAGPPRWPAATCRGRGCRLRAAWPLLCAA